MTEERHDPPTPAPDEDAEVIPVTREVLRVDTRQVPAARVAVRKRVTTDEQTIDLPLVRDEVTVERVPRNELVAAPPPVRQEGDTTIVPVLEEVLVVEKRLRLREELRIVRRRRAERHTRRVALRREDVTVERTAASGAGPQGEESDEEEATMNEDRYTIIGLFDRREEALACKQDLIAAGCDAGAISLSEQAGAQAGGKSFWTKLKEAFGAQETRTYDEAARRGGTLLEIDDLPAERLDLCADILQRHGAVDIDQRMAEWTGSGAQGASTLAATEREEETIPVTEERLKVGTRFQKRGGVRIYSRVKEVPVTEDVTLREERVHVERRPVDRPAEAGAFEERTVEMTELHEEPVVSKESRVVEEVVLGKDVEQHQETIEDTVRKIEVEVQDLEVDFQRDFQERYASSGVTYEQVRPAYDYGRELAQSEAGKNTSWDLIESRARTDFEQRNPGLWDRYSGAVRRGYERSLLSGRR